MSKLFNMNRILRYHEIIQTGQGNDIKIKHTGIEVLLDIKQTIFQIIVFMSPSIC